MATEVLYATSHLAGTFSNPSNAVGNTPLTWAGDLNTNTNYTSRWALGNPSNPLTSGATQTVRVLARKGLNSGTPTLALNLYENGVLVGSILGATSITSSVGQTLTATFNSSAISNGANVEIEVVQTGAGGSGSVRNSAQIAYIEWTADSSAVTNFTLVVPDGTHGHTADSLALTQVHGLAVADAVHAHAADAAVLAIPANLSVADATHEHTADVTTVDFGTTQGLLGSYRMFGEPPTFGTTPALAEPITEFDLTVADASHGHAADGADLTQQHELSVDDSSHAHTADSVVLAQQHNLTVADASHSHTADSIATTQAHALGVDPTSHTHTADPVALEQTHALTVADASHTLGSDNVALAVTGSLGTTDAGHAHTADNVTLTQAHSLAVDSADHNHTAESLTVGVAATLTVNETVHSHAADAPAVTAGGVLNLDLVVAEAHHGHSTSEPEVGRQVELAGRRILTATLTGERRLSHDLEGRRVLTVQLQGSTP